MTFVKAVVLMSIFVVASSGWVELVFLSIQNNFSEYFHNAIKTPHEKLRSQYFEASMRFLLGFIAYCVYQILEECRKIRAKGFEDNYVSRPADRSRHV